MGRGERLPIIIPRLDDPAAASADERDEHLMLLEVARHELEVQFTKTLAAADAAGDHDLFSYPSSVAYLKDRLRMAGGRAHRYVKRARAALRHRATFAAWTDRDLSTDQADLMFQTSDRLPDKYPQAETVLLEIVGDSVTETKQVLDYWTHEVGRPGLDLEEQLVRRRFDITRRANGMVAGEFELPSLAGETLLTALDVLMPPPTPDESRTNSQRRADALEDLARSYLEGSETPIVGGEKPHLTVHVDLDALAGKPGDLHETEDGQVIVLESIDQLACDASITRVVFDASSEVVDVGRRTRVIPAALRRAIIARDRHCTWPGCQRSSRWCDVHHVVPWSEGGDTVLSNLCLLCRYHHTLTHLEIVPEDENDDIGLVGAGRRRSS